MTTPNLFSGLPADDLAVLERYLEPRRFAKDTHICKEGDPGDGCYIIDAGEVRLEVEHPEIDTDTVLGYLQPGEFLGEFSLLDKLPRSSSAYAHTDVVARWLSADALDSLHQQHPGIGLTIVGLLGQSVAVKMRGNVKRLSQFLFANESDPEIDAMVAAAVAAQQTFEPWPEERVDSLLRDIAETIAAHAEDLAAATVAETGIGDAADKAAKNRFASLGVYESLAGKPAAGLINVDAARHVAEIASPVGVVLGIIPMTNPVATVIFKTLIALKGRNALILSCHRNALGVGGQTGELIQAVLRRHDAPAELVQWVRRRVSRARTQALMQHRGVSFILATGGPSIVKAAYSSGTPAIGVGAGNAPALICADADLDGAARCVVQSKSFDNGVICGSEHNLVVDASVRAPFIAALEAHGAMILTEEQARQFADKGFTESGKLHPRMLGQSALRIAQMLDLPCRPDVRLIVVAVGTDALTGPYAHEKLAPVLSLFTAAGFEAGLAQCQQILAGQGLGHTAIIHTESRDLAQRFGAAVAACRILVNMPGSHGCVGIVAGLAPSLTLGCGTFGGNSTSDNVTYTHLLNIKRVAYVTA